MNDLILFLDCYERMWMWRKMESVVRRMEEGRGNRIKGKIWMIVVMWERMWKGEMRMRYREIMWIVFIGKK